MCYVGWVFSFREPCTLLVLDLENERGENTASLFFKSQNRTWCWSSRQARGHHAGRSGFISLRCLRSRRRHLAATMHEQSPCCRMVCLAQVPHVVVVKVVVEVAFAVRKEQWSRYGMTDDPH